jgi:hypothetical protein
LEGKNVKKFGKICALVIVGIFVCMTLPMSAVAPPPPSALPFWGLEGNDAGPDDVLGTTNDEDLRIVTNGDQKMVITSGGNVGIGIAVPTEKLDVNGNIRASGHFIAGTTTTYGDGFIDLSMGTNLDIDSNTLYIDSTKNQVGIGTNFPGARLGVKSAYQNSEVVRVHAWDGGPLFRVLERSDGSAGMDMFDTNHNRRVLLNSNGDSYLNGGNVGIGTASPTEKLDVLGNIKASGTVTSGSSITIDGINDKITATSGTIDFDNENLVTAGKVGIGTTSPTQQLTLATDWGTRLEITKTSSSFPFQQSTGAVNSGSFVINHQSEGSSKPGADFALMRDGLQRLVLGNYDTYIGSQGGGDIHFLAHMGDHENVEELMRITASGNVGIGTTDPTQELHVDGDWTISGNDMYSAVSGNVGIGTTSPTRDLDVAGDGVIVARKSIIVNHNDPFAIANTAGLDVYNKYHWTYPLKVRDNTDNVIFTVKNTGDVGIGTIHPGAKLDVEVFGPIGSVGGAATIGHSSNSATGDFAIAMGVSTIASGDASTAIGYGGEASGHISTTMGAGTIAIGDYSTAMGWATTAEGDYSTAMGSDTTAEGDYSTAMGIYTIASGEYSTAMGASTRAIGARSTAMGYDTEASGSVSTAMGYDTEASKSYSTAMGNSIWVDGENSFGIGLDFSFKKWKISQDNTMAIMGGNVGIGTVWPKTKLDVVGTVTATEFRDFTPVAFHAYNYLDDSYSTSWIIVDFEIEEFDYGNNFDTTTDTFTAPTNGVYQFNAIVSVWNIDIDENMRIYLKKNGEWYKFLDGEFSSKSNTKHILSGSVTVHLSAGDTIQVGFSTPDLDYRIDSFIDGLSTHFSGHRVA